MKSKFLTLTLAVLTLGLLGSCSKIYERIDNLDKKVEAFENDRIASVDEQVASISSSIADIGTMRQNIKKMMTAVDNITEEDIREFKVADEALGRRIEDLQGYVDRELTDYAKSEWVEATLATLKQHEWTCDTIAKIDARLGALDARISEAIETCTDSMKTWVSAELDSYYTAAQADAKIAELRARLDTLSNADKKQQAQFATELAATKVAIDTAKANISTEYKTAVEAAILAHEGNLTETIKSKVRSVNSKVDDLTSRIETLEGKVETLRSDIDTLKTVIQSVTIIPAFGDGSVKVEKDSLYIDCIVEPKTAVAKLKKDNFKVLVSTVETKAAPLAVGITDDKDFSKNADEGTVSVKVKVAEYFTSADASITVALNVRNTVSDYTTKFMKVSGTCFILPDGSLISEAQEYVGKQDDYRSKDIDLRNAKIMDTDIRADKTIHFVLQTTSPPDKVSFTLPEIPNEFSETCTGWTIEYQDGYPTKNVEVTAPAGTNVTILAPTSHVILNGESYKDITAKTGYNTIVIPKGVTVSTFTVIKGAVEIHGTVTNLIVNPEAGENVYFRACEGLKQDVFEKIKGDGFNHIDPAYVEQENTDGTYDIVLKDCFLPGEFTVDDSGKQVRFAKGNLKQSGSTYSIDDSGSATDEKFRWDEKDGVFFTEDPDFKIDGQNGVMHTLTSDEWEHLLDNYNNDWSTVNGKDGLVIASSKNGTIAQEYTEEDWAKAESSGYIFLPVSDNGTADYWSSTEDLTSSGAECLSLNKQGTPSIASKSKSYECLIRLVTVTYDANPGISIEQYTDGGNLLS